MSLDEFLAEQRCTLDAFEKFWREGMATWPGDFPIESGPGDWHEQLAIFDPHLDARRPTMTPDALESLARRVETEEPTPELTAAVLTALGCESEPGSAPEPLTRVDDAKLFEEPGWIVWGLFAPYAGDGWDVCLANHELNNFINAKAPAEARARTAAILRARAWYAKNA